MITNKQNNVKHNRGITIVEVVVSVAILAVLLSVTGRSVASFYVSLEMQKERMAAAHAGKSVLGAIREKREEFEGEFPTALIEWIRSANMNNWEPYLLLESPYGKLDDHKINVTCTNLAGGEPADGDTLVQVSVLSSWTGMRGRPMRSVVACLMTDR